MRCHLAFVLYGPPLAFACSGGVVGCGKSCPVDVATGTATSQLSYTEPTAAQTARVADLQAGTNAPATLNAERTRGTTRVTNEARTFDGDSVATSSSTISVTSTLSFTIVVQGSTVHVPLSVVSVHFDKPSHAGMQSLSDLHATVCESVTVHGSGGTATDQHQEACGAASGSIDFRPSSASDFDADVTFTSAAPLSDSPSLTGSAHLHYEVTQENTPCGDVGAPHVTTP